MDVDASLAEVEDDDDVWMVRKSGEKVNLGQLNSECSVFVDECLFVRGWVEQQPA